VVGNQNVLRLQVPVVDPNGMTELDGIQNLQESMLGQMIVAHEPAVLGDVREQVTLGAEFDHNEGAVRAFQDAQEGHNIGMVTCLIVQSDLSSLEAALPGIQSSLG
jgi:hypothetical protein